MSEEKLKTYDVQLSNGAIGEMEVSQAFINKLIAAGYDESEISDPKKLLQLICNFAANAQ